MPRVTTAACEADAAGEVDNSAATSMPAIRSAVSPRTRMMVLYAPLLWYLTASSAVKTICPTAAPGDAGRPVARTSIFFRPFRQGVERGSHRAGSVRRGDGFFLRDEAFAHHINGDANGGEAGTLAVAGLQHVELSILDGELEILHVAIVLFHLPGDGAEMVVDLGHGALEFADRAGANTGDNVFALASIRYSPKNIFSPVAGLRVKPTPVPEFSPRLPKTMACTLTAVPSQSSM